MRGRFVVGLVVGCAVASCAAPALSQPLAAPVCGPTSAQTLAADAVARVYGENQTIYACALPGGQSITLGSSALRARPQIGPVALAGTVVAYGSRFFGVDVSRASVIVLQLTDARGLSNFAAQSYVYSLVVRSNGSAAWICSGPHHSATRGRFWVTQVRRGQGTHVTLLDHSSHMKIALQSLRLRGSRLTWKHGARVRHATLR